MTLQIRASWSTLASLTCLALILVPPHLARAVTASATPFRTRLAASSDLANYRPRAAHSRSRGKPRPHSLLLGPVAIVPSTPSSTSRLSTPAVRTARRRALSQPAYVQPRAIRPHLNPGCFNVPNVIFCNWNIWAVSDGPPNATTFTTSMPYLLTEIIDYHYPNGPSSGNISLRNVNTGQTFGPWSIVASQGFNNTPYSIWTASINGVFLPAGTYQVLDSVPSQWSYNDTSSGEGFSEVVGPALIGGGTVPWHPHQSVRLSSDPSLSAQVDLADGHLDLQAQDLSLPGRGPDLGVEHIWDSVLGQAGITSTAGQGWLTSLTPSLGGVLTETVVFTDESGATWPFTYTGSLPGSAPFASYQTTPGLPWQLSTTNLVTATVGYTLSNILTGETLTFDRQGRYLADTDAYGNANSLSYGASGPISVTNSGGRTLALTYTAGLLSELTSPLWRQTSGAQGQRVTDAYTNTNQLASLTWGAGSTDALTATFGYSGTQLVTVTTPYTQAPHAWLIGYDPAGRVVSITSPVSGTQGQAGYTPAYTTSFAYNPGQTIVTQGAGTGAAIVLTYTLDAQGEATATQDALNHTTRRSYDADHDVLTSVDGDGNTTTSYYQYVGPSGPGGLGSTGLVTETVSPPVSVGDPTAVPIPLTTRYWYNGTNDLIETDTPLGGYSLNQYDLSHGVITSTQMLTQTAGSGCPQAPIRHVRPHALHPYSGCSYTLGWRAQVHQRDAYGEEVATIDGRGLTVGQTVLQQAQVGQGPVAVPSVSPGPCPGGTCATAFTHTFVYSPAGDLGSESTPPIQTTLNGVQQTGPVTTSFSYDADGNQVGVTSANGTTTRTAYDHLGRPVSTTLPPVTLSGGTVAQPVQTTGYDGEGNVVRQVDGAGDVSLSSYDPLGRLVSRTDPVQATTLTTYTATEPVASQDAKGNVMQDAYDAAGRVITTTDALQGTTVYTYDAASNVLTTTLSAVGASSPIQVEGRQYDALNRVVTDTIGAPGQPPSTTVTSYDQDGHVQQVEQPNGDVDLYFYDPADQLSATTLFPGLLLNPVSAGAPRFLSYAYDAAGNQYRQTDADGRVQARSVDGDNRTTQTVDVTGTTILTTTQGFDPDGNTLTQTVTTTLSGGPSTTRSLTATVNAADWTTSTGDSSYSTTPLVTAYGYDAAGRPVMQSALTTTLPVTRVLDAQGRLTAQGESLAGTSAYTGTFGYDPTDAPITSSLPNAVTTGTGYDAKGRLITATLAGPAGVGTPLANSYGYAYNPADWTTALTTAVGGITTTQLITHDMQGRLLAVTDSAGNAQSWSYDGNGNLLTGVLNGQTTLYSYTASITPNELLTQTVLGGTPITSVFGYDQNGGHHQYHQHTQHHDHARLRQRGAPHHPHRGHAHHHDQRLPALQRGRPALGLQPVPGHDLQLRRAVHLSGGGAGPGGGLQRHHQLHRHLPLRRARGAAGADPADQGGGQPVHGALLVRAGRARECGGADGQQRERGGPLRLRGVGQPGEQQRGGAAAAALRRVLVRRGAGLVLGQRALLFALHQALAPARPQPN